MSSFLLLFSFILNGIALLAIIILYLRQNRLLETEEKLNHTFKETETLISSYLFEMKEENEAFMDRFHKMIEEESSKKQTSFTEPSSHDDQEEVLFFQHNNEQTDHNKLPNIEHTSRLQAINTYKKLSNQATKSNISLNKQPKSRQTDEPNHSSERFINEQKEKQTEEQTIKTTETKQAFQQLQQALEKKETTVYDEIILLQQSGLSIEEIAKKLNRGKTEVELILKLR